MWDEKYRRELAAFRAFAMKKFKDGRNQVEDHKRAHHRHRRSEIAKYERLIGELGDLLLYLKRREGRAGASVGRSQRRQLGNSVAAVAWSGTRSQSRNLAVQQDARHDLSDLPPELLEELTEEARREVGHQLIEIIDGRGGTATLDEILIDLYRKYKKVGKRANVAKRLLFLSRTRLMPVGAWCQ